jgi:hypothetical protein
LSSTTSIRRDPIAWAIASSAGRLPKLDLQRRRDGGRHQRRVADGREIGNADAVLERSSDAVRERAGQRRLAHAAGAGEGNQPMVLHERRERGQVIFPAEQRCELMREMGLNRCDRGRHARVL